MTSPSTDLQKWFPYRKARPEARIRLFCFAYAGGTASMFRGCQQRLPPHVEVCAVQLPGRESRIQEPPFTRMKPLVETLVSVIAPLLDRPFALFGYSLGAAIAFESARGIKKDVGVDPLGLFACARRGPQLEIRHTPRHLLDADTFKKVLRRLGGTPEEALANDKLMDVLLPLLRADFELTETYLSADFAASASTAPELDKLCCPVQVYGGKEDTEVTAADLNAWQECTTGPCNVRMFDGTHFVHRHRPEILGEIGELLAAWTAARLSHP